jgi:phage tail sheath protein FI
MPEYLHPGVYIEEIERGPRPIEGVATSTAAFLGETERGPTRPRMVTSYNEYARWFGGTFGADKYMPYAVNGFFDNGGRRAYICRIVSPMSDTEVAKTASHDFDRLHVEATGPGRWGNHIWVQIEGSATTVSDLGNPPKPIPAGIRLRIAYWGNVADDFTPFNPFENELKPRPTIVEDNFNDLSFDEASPDYLPKRVNGSSQLIYVTVGTGNAPAPSTGAALADGDQGAGPLTSADFQGKPLEAGKPKGLDALELDDFRDVALVYAPGITDKTLLIPIITHCELQKFRFAVVDCDPSESDLSKIDPRTNIQESQYAAFYYPWIKISDPQNGALREVPPGGHMLGIYARTDSERGVFKAPANEVVRGALDVKFDVNERIQDNLNPKGVNAIRKFPGRGILLWGARTMSANTLWKYVSVRRLFIFLEHSIYDGTQWVVFEPNDERLWARVKDTIRLFLRTQWREGAMMGKTEQEAFFITCDRTTMTQDDILNGRLICEIGIAPVRPAEFVIFRIFQNTAEAQT